MSSSGTRRVAADRFWKELLSESADNPAGEVLQLFVDGPGIDGIETEIETHLALAEVKPMTWVKISFVS
jgi:hypothetical protein